VLLLTGAAGARILRRLLGSQAERIAADTKGYNGV
jgi:nucleotide-binding universal stress UspA family protein